MDLPPPPKTEIVLYYKPTCPYCQKVLKYLKSVGKEIPLKDISKDSAAKKKLLLGGGKKQVPCLYIDGKWMYESSDIVNWLSHHPESY